MSAEAGAEVVLEAAGVETPDPAPGDIERALGGPRDDDWVVSLRRGDDYMEAMIDGGGLWVECQDGERFLQARSRVDEETLRAMFLAFRDGSPGWRDLADWKEPPPARRGSPPGIVLGAALSIAFVVVAGVIAAIVTGKGGWIVLMFALLLPALIALAAAVKEAEARRAARWTKAQGRVVRSELVTEKRHGKEVRVPRVEYEFSVGFHKYAGRRLSLAEVIAEPEAMAALARYPVGARVPVYYDPADPGQSVIERELPPFFKAIWGAVAALTALILAAGWHYLSR